MGNLEGVVGASFGPLISAQERSIHRERLRGDPSLTYGDWQVEAELEDELVGLLGQLGCFEIHRQIPGRPLYLHHFKPLQEVRADLLLIPGEKLLKAGWHEGVIVVEVKRSGERIAPGLAQVADYLACGFTLPSGVVVVPSYGFLFPVEIQRRTVAGLMLQGRTGGLRYAGGTLEFHCGEFLILSLSLERGISVNPQSFGRKTGAR